MAVIGFIKNLDSHPELSSILNDICFAWLEGIMRAKIDYFQNLNDWKDLERWPSGRIFGPSCEYRWRSSQDEGLNVVLIMDERDLPGSFEGKVIIEKTRDENMILWGDWINPEIDKDSNPDGSARFYAPELPLIQSYPLPSDDTQKPNHSPVLCIRRYQCSSMDEKGGLQGEFARCVNVTMAPTDQ